MDNPTHQLTDEQMDAIIAMVENAVADAVRNAVHTVVGYQAPPKRKKGRPASPDREAALAEKILAVLARAPDLTTAHPEFAKYLRLRAMPKTMLRRQVGNSYRHFDEVLENLVTDGRLIKSGDRAASGRHVVLFGLP